MSDEQTRLRAVIDDADERLLQVLAERSRAVQALWAWKADHGLPQRDPHREAELRARLLARAEALGLEPAAIARVLAEIIGRRLFR